jgi:hypothetical protein
MVIPAVNKPMASVFCGARTDVKVKTAECMSYMARVSNLPHSTITTSCIGRVPRDICMTNRNL